MKIYYIKHDTNPNDYLGSGLSPSKQLRKIWAGAGPMKCAIGGKYWQVGNWQTGLKDLKARGYSIIEIDITSGQFKNVTDDWLNQV